MTEYLQQQIAVRRSRLASIDKERTALLAELTAYEDALANATPDTAQSSMADRGKRQDRALRVSKAWQAILERLGSFKHFNAIDVKTVAQQLYATGELKKPQTNDGVRAQLSLYAKRGLVTRTGNGRYVVTDETKATLVASSRVSHPQTKTTWVRAAYSDPSDGG